jgi:chromosome partitioning protein
MTTTLALFSEKGGVGKTTLCINLGAALAKAGQRVLIIDADSQATASELLMDGQPNREGQDLPAVLLGECDAADAIHAATESFGLSLIPAGAGLADAQVELTNLPGRDMQLRYAVNAVRDQFDWILLDCPPGRGILSVTALAAADLIMLPMDPSRGGLFGVQRGIELANKVRRFCADSARPGAPAILGVVLNRIQRNKTHAECAENLQTNYGSLYLGSIPAAVAVDTAGWNAAAVINSDPTSPPAKAILELAKRVKSHAKSAA